MSSLPCFESQSDRLPVLSGRLNGTCRQSALAAHGKACSIFLSFLLLVFFAADAFAQNQSKGPAEQSDVSASIRQLIQAEQSEAVQPAPAAGDVRTQPLIRIFPYGRSGKQVKTGIKTQLPLNAHLTYFGGPVVSNIQVVVIFWGAHVAAALTGPGAIDQFYTDITSSQYFDELTEYSTLGIKGADGVSTSNQEINHGSFLNKFTINPSLCPGTAACSLTDAQIQTELTRQINAGHLPAPQTDAHGNVNTYYAIYFPPNVIISLGNAQSCEQGGFCAYHSSTPGLIPYGVFPDFSVGGCAVQGACGVGTALQIATVASSHEMAETVTDIGAGVAAGFGPPLGWFDGANNQEIADLCDPLDTSVTAGGHSYNVELVFSDLRGACAVAPPVFSMTAPAGGAGPAIPFNMTLRIEDGNGGLLPNYRGTVHFTSGDAGATLPADYTFTAADAGKHTFPFTLSLLGNQTITATDARSSGFTGTTTVNVNTIPDMTVAVTHSGNFGTGQTGSYTITASNVGGGASSGTVIVGDSLPLGLNVAAIGGTGWSCIASNVTCSRTDVLAAGQSYPPITLTANVTVGPTTVTNVVQVSGGGETVASDNQASDPTKIVNPGVDLAAAFISTEVSVSQGDLGDTFTANVTNLGSVGSSGTVTFSATLVAGLTATNLSGTGWACTVTTLTCTRSDVLASAQSYPPITVTFSVAPNASLGTSSISVSVSGGGTDTTPGNNTSSLPTVIGAALSFLSSTPTQIVTAGNLAVFQVRVDATASAGTVTFSCIDLPQGATCSFTPPSLTNSTALVTMDVSTTARAALLNGPQPEDRNPWLLLGLLVFAAMAGAGFKLLTTPRRRRRLVPAFGVCTLLIAGIMAGCGGGSGASTKLPNPQGTPAGTYTITFTATSSNTNIAPVSQTMTLQVQ
ncbi:MAG TPA: hypothetical protein VFP59_12205 [Candidatus Angelobacter sp.]|nr:hypothetical protein [Candidatus Angelobacter sp.]